MGDTWHPADGFVNESHFENLKTVDELLAVDYDFRGLVIFKGHVGRCMIEYNGENYRIRGIKKEIEKLKQKLRADGCNGWQQRI